MGYTDPSSTVPVQDSLDSDPEQTAAERALLEANYTSPREDDDQ